jgi:hypothetical protein
MAESDNLDLQLEREIDAALSTYGEAGPGLDERVLARLSTVRRTARVRRPRSWMPWVLAAPVAACLMIAIHFGVRYPVLPAKQVIVNSPRNVLTATSAVPGLPAAQGKHARRERVLGTHSTLTKLTSQPAPLPKRDIFPSPQPLSRAEEALVAYAARATESERRAFVAAQPQMDAPLNVSAIDVSVSNVPPLKPLQTDEN